MDVEIENAYGKTRSDEFIAMNPCHCCPTLEIDDKNAIWEVRYHRKMEILMEYLQINFLTFYVQSGAILRYLCNISPEGSKLYPSDPLQRAKVDMALDWRQTALYPCLPALGYAIFGAPIDVDEARKQFKKLLEQFTILCDVFLKDTKFIYSDTPTIADLAVAPPLTFIKTLDKFWDAVPEKVKAYHKNVLDAFPEIKENFDMLDAMTTGFTGENHDIEP